MLPDLDYARQLDAKLDVARNSPDAVAALLAALDRFPASNEPDFQPGPEDWDDYDNYLERLEYERRYHINFRFI